MSCMLRVARGVSKAIRRRAAAGSDASHVPRQARCQNPGATHLPHLLDAQRVRLGVSVSSFAQPIATNGLLQQQGGHQTMDSQKASTAANCTWYSAVMQAAIHRPAPVKPSNQSQFTPQLTQHSMRQTRQCCSCWPSLCTPQSHPRCGHTHIWHPGLRRRTENVHACLP